MVKRQNRSGRDRPVYMISVAAELADMHPQTLRVYERKQLVQPQRSAGNTRLYSEADIDRLRLIQRLTKEEGVNLAGVMRIIELEIEKERVEAELTATRSELTRTECQLADEIQKMRESRGGSLVHVPGGRMIRRYER